MQDEDFDRILKKLESAKDFLTYFGVDFDPPVVHVNRLHILQRFHDYLAGVGRCRSPRTGATPCMPICWPGPIRISSHPMSARSKVFRVFRSQAARVDLEDLTARLPHGS